MTLYENFIHQLQTIKSDIALLNETIANTVASLLEQTQTLHQNMDDMSKILGTPPETKVFMVGKDKQFEHPTEALEFIKTQSTVPNYKILVDPWIYLFPYIDNNRTAVPAVLDTPHRVSFESSSKDPTHETVFQMGENFPIHSTLILFSQRSQGEFHGITFRGPFTLNSENLPKTNYQALIVKRYATLKLENCHFYNFHTAVLATLHGAIIANKNHSHQNVNFCQLTLNSRAHIDNLVHTGIIPKAIIGNEKYLYSGCCVALNSKGWISNSVFSNAENGCLLAQYGGVIQAKNNIIHSQSMCMFALNGGHFQGYQTNIRKDGPSQSPYCFIYSFKGFNFFHDISLEKASTDPNPNTPPQRYILSALAGTVLYQSPQPINCIKESYGQVQKLI